MLSGEGHVMMKAEIGVMLPQLRNSRSHWKLKERMKDPPLETSREE